MWRRWWDFFTERPGILFITNMRRKFSDWHWEQHDRTVGWGVSWLAGVQQRHLPTAGWLVCWNFPFGADIRGNTGEGGGVSLEEGFWPGPHLLPIQSHLVLLPCRFFVKRFDISPHLHSCCFISSNYQDNICFQLLKSLHASFLDFFMFIPETRPEGGDLTGPLSLICPADILVKTKGRFNNKTLHFRAWDFLIFLALIKFIFTPNLCLKSAMPFQKIKYRPLRAVGSEERREEREKRIGGVFYEGYCSASVL